MTEGQGKSFTRDVAVHTTALLITYSIVGLAGLVGLGSWLLGSFSEFWREILSVCLAVWRGITHPLEIPLWVFLCTAAACWAALKRRAPIGHIARDAASAEQHPEPVPTFDQIVSIIPPPPHDDRLTDAEEDVIIVLARADGDSRNEVEISRIAKMARLIVQDALGSLIDKGLVEKNMSPASGYYYLLSDTGRKFAIKKRLVRTPGR
jgi:hypothetical protein